MAGIAGTTGLTQLLPLLLAAKAGSGVPAGPAPGGGAPSLQAGAPAAQGTSAPALASLIQNPMGMMLLRAMLAAGGGKTGQGAPVPAQTAQRPATGKRTAPARMQAGAQQAAALPPNVAGGNLPPQLAAMLGSILSGAAPTQQPTMGLGAGPYVPSSLNPSVSSALATILGLS